jgi:hypothetical protein
MLPSGTNFLDLACSFLSVEEVEQNSGVLSPSGQPWYHTTFGAKPTVIFLFIFFLG